MKNLFKIIAVVLFLIFVGCNDNRQENDRYDSWIDTDASSGKINMAAVKEAIEQSNNPTELENRINEIYEGSKLIIIKISSTDDGRKEISGWEDLNNDGVVDFNIDVRLFSSVMGQKNFELQGYGRNDYYRERYNFTDGFATAMVLNWMFTPTYATYITPVHRIHTIRTYRTTYRKSNRYAKQKNNNSSYRKKASKKYGNKYKKSIKKISPNRKKYTKAVKKNFEKRNKKSIAKGGFGKGKGIKKVKSKKSIWGGSKKSSPSRKSLKSKPKRRSSKKRR